MTSEGRDNVHNLQPRLCLVDDEQVDERQELGKMPTLGYSSDNYSRIFGFSPRESGVAVVGHGATTRTRQRFTEMSCLMMLYKMAHKTARNRGPGRCQWL